MPSRLPIGVSRTSAGWRISVRRKGQPLWQKRFPPQTPLDTIESELKAARTKLGVRAGHAPAGTLEADITRYLRDYFTGRPGYAERTRHLALWQTALGASTWRRQITRDDIARVLNGWRAAGLAADTCNKRRTALLALYHALDGRGGENPVRELPKYRAPDPLPRGLSYTLIERALKKLPACKTRARLRLIAYTGIRHGQLMQLSPDDWHVKAKTLTVPGTGKGRGTKPYTIPLSSAAEAALRELDACEGWGPFTWAPMARMWKAAATAAHLPAGTVPYDLRHSFGTHAYQQTGDLKITKELMGHASLKMTERYTLAAVPARQRAAMLQIEAGLPKQRHPRKLPVRVASRANRSGKQRKV